MTTRSNTGEAQSKNCACCTSTNLRHEPTLTSLFLSRAAWNGSPESTNLIYCNNCGFRTYQRTLTEPEARNYYSNYRDDFYMKERCRDEIFYTRAAYNKDEEWMMSPRRQQELLAIVKDSGLSLRNLRVLDFGGGDGRLINNIPAKELAVFDYATILPLPGIAKIPPPDPCSWDFVVCAQTLEHISNPINALSNIRSITATNGFIYIELPVQNWRSLAGNGALRKKILELSMKNRTFHKLADLYSTAFRVKFGILPPCGFVPMREHVNFFTLKSIVSLGENLSLKTIAARINSFSGIQVIFKKTQI